MTDWADNFWSIRNTETLTSTIGEASLYELPNINRINRSMPFIQKATLKVKSSELMFLSSGPSKHPKFSFTLQTEYPITKYSLDSHRAIYLYVLYHPDTNKHFAFEIINPNHEILFEAYYLKLYGKPILASNSSEISSKTNTTLSQVYRQEETKEPAHYKFSSPVVSEPRPSLYSTLNDSTDERRFPRHQAELNSSYSPVLSQALDSSLVNTPIISNRDTNPRLVQNLVITQTPKQDLEARFPRNEIITPPCSSTISAANFYQKAQMNLTPSSNSAQEARFPKDAMITPPSSNQPSNSRYLQKELTTPQRSHQPQDSRSLANEFITPTPVRTVHFAQPDTQTPSNRQIGSPYIPPFEEQTPSQNLKVHLSSSETVLFTSACDLYEFLSEIDDKVLRYQNAKFTLKKQREYECMIEISFTDRFIKRVDLVGKLIYSIYTNEKKLMWIDPINSSGEVKCWVCIIYDEIDKLQQLMSKNMYEINKKSSQIKDDTRDWIQSVNTADDEKEESFIEDEDEKLWAEHYSSEPNDTENKESKQSQCRPITFLAQNGKIKVYDTDSMFRLRNEFNLPFQPRNILPINQDAKMLILDANNSKVVHVLDIPTQSIEATFNLHQPAKHIYTSHKLSPQGNEHSFFSLSSNGVSRQDLRQTSPVMSREYKTGNFTSASILRDGKYALADESGKIRLYPDIEYKNAINIIPSLGDSIFYLDATLGGDWILATTVRYLILIPTKSKNGSGFDCRLGNKKRPPKKLTISPEDLARYNIREIRFTAAKFNIDQMDRETSIVTTTGNYMIIWNFNKVKAGKLFDYKIMRMDNYLLGAEFEHGRDTEIVATMPNKLTLNKRSIASTI